MLPETTCDSAAYYTVVHSHEFAIDWRAFYRRADELTARTRNCLPCCLNVRYGDGPKRKLDVYLAPDADGPAPVFVFLHGGGFREGDRAHYGFVADRLAEHGIVTVVPSYRLAPDARFPEQPEDVRSVLEWTYRSISAYHGDAERIHVGGHSAGAILSAFVGADSTWAAASALPPDVVKGFVPISGGYDLTQRALEPDGYVADLETARAASPLFGIARPARRAVVAVGSLEPYVDASRELVDALRGADVEAELLVLDEMDHAETALALADEGPLTQRIVDLVRA